MSAALQDRLGTMFGRRTILVGRGSTAIWLALDAIRARAGTGEVLLPSIGCAAIAQLVVYAGFTPRWVDLRLDDYTIDPAALERAITSDTRAIIAVHLFGHACDMTAIMRVAQAHALYVIEDAAQSLGGVHDGRLLGSIGDIGVLSFAGEKIVNAGAGGAILVNNESFSDDIASRLSELPAYVRSPQFALKALSHRNLYHGVVDLLRADNQLRLERVFQTAMDHYRDLYLERYPEEDSYAVRLIESLETLEQNLARRIERAERYHELLAPLPLDRSENWRQSRSLWRYTFMLRTPEDAFRVTAALRRNRIHASNHYWSLADIFAGDKSLPNTSWFCPRVVNLWVDDSADDDYIRRSCDIVSGVLT